MEGYWTRTPDRDGSSSGRAEEFVLPSRGRVLEACLGGLGQGPVLITGEAGVGKTWLAGRIAEEADEPASWIVVDLTPSLDIGGLLRVLGRRLGLETPACDALAIAETLADEAAEGRRWGLILDEAHLASDVLLEEVRLLSNRLGRPDGFAAMVLVGQPALLRRLAMRSASALASRLAARVHLRAIDADEAGVLIDHLAPGRALDNASLERCHRDAAGNPRRLLALANRDASAERRSAARRALADDAGADRPTAPPGSRAVEGWTERIPRVDRPMPLPEPDAEDPDHPRTAEGPATLEPPFEPFLVRTPFGLERPPIASGDGMIEVGWESDDLDDEPEDLGGEDDPIVDDEPQDDRPAPAERPAGVADDAPEMERLADHYAALQAWEEWSRNQGGPGEGGLLAPANLGDQAIGSAVRRLEDRDDPGRPEGSARPGREESARVHRANLRAEEQHGHSPYGPLFVVGRGSRDPEA